MRSDLTPTGRWLHRYAVFMAFAVIGLISAGALVTSREAGLSVPDWPLSYGTLNPPGWWRALNVRAEHGHRLIAGTVALLTVGLAVWAGRREPRRWVRRIAYLAVAAVLAQALLGGITVLYFLPTAVSVSHAALAEIFLCLIVTLAVVTSRSWAQADFTLDRNGGPRGLARWATAATAVIYGQILIGAVMRHSGAGLAIPDFPLAFGRLVPERFDFAIGIHYAHRIGALLVLALVLSLVIQVWRRFRRDHLLLYPVIVMGVLVLAQVTLGATVVLTAKAVTPNTLHVATGAALLASSLILTLHARRCLQVVERHADPAEAGKGLELQEAAP